MDRLKGEVVSFDLFDCPSHLLAVSETATTYHISVDISSLSLWDPILKFKPSSLSYFVPPAVTKTEEEKNTYDKDVGCKEKLVYWLITLCGAASLLWTLRMNTRCYHLHKPAQGGQGIGLIHPLPRDPISG